MGGATPNLVLETAARKRRGFHLTSVPDTTEGKIVVVDASGFMHCSWNRLTDQQIYEEAVKLHESRENDTPYEPGRAFTDAIVNTTLKEIDFLTTVLKFREVKLVYDGQRNLGKEEEKADRMEKCLDSYDEASISNREACSGSMYLTWGMYKISIGAAIAGGVKVYVAIGEADPQIAHMCILGEADVAFFDDGDLWVHGVRKGIVGMLGKRKKISGKQAYEGYYYDLRWPWLSDWFPRDGNTGMCCLFALASNSLIFMHT
jgi:XPG I-region